MIKRAMCVAAAVISLNGGPSFGQQYPKELTDAIAAQAKARSAPPPKINGMTFVGPKYDGNFEALVDGNPPQEVQLERQSMTLEENVKAFGLGGTEAFQKISGQHSTVRFRAGKSIAFVVRGYIGNVDPSQIYEIISLTPHGKDRTIPMIRAGLTLRGQSINPSTIQFDMSQMAPGFYKLMPTSPLKPGEYVVRKVSDLDSDFFFGIDPDN